MIKPTPNTYAGKVLTLLVDYPDELDTSQIAKLLEPPPGRTQPFTGPADLRKWVAYREECIAAARNRASNALENLKRLGLVSPRGPARLSPSFLECQQKRGVHGALAFFALAYGKKVVLRHHALTIRFLESTGFALPVASVGTGRAPRDAYADLVEWGVVVPPSYRSASEAGIELVKSWRKHEGA